MNQMGATRENKGMLSVLTFENANFMRSRFFQLAVLGNA